MLRWWRHEQVGVSDEWRPGGPEMGRGRTGVSVKSCVAMSWGPSCDSSDRLLQHARFTSPQGGFGKGGTHQRYRSGPRPLRQTDELGREKVKELSSLPGILAELNLSASLAAAV